ncbi:hypothetical protein BDQ17DRAFT_1364011 [Cyathus striatus]|nr:hypothetical protein BDQ17DRAFT_1364011 [Cyathus striatus]
MPIILKTLFISPLLLEITFILLSNSFPRVPSPSVLTFQFLLGWFINLLGGLLRQACYNTLGTFFTFEMGTRNDQKLIITGPYAVVRHPSYTGALINYIGCLLVFKSCGWVPRPVWGAVWVIMSISLSTILNRVVVEDEMLKKEFGTDWESWRERVPYRLVPWIY